ncbi:radical SAM/SPASM domain-containing protein [Sulfuricurvum sp.]|uniref:radical SAM/SPASM domain-containing protein n=1 Tax=Sulfuricurvum sp. TaxID=2025608 RepID=UPI0035628697
MNNVIYGFQEHLQAEFPSQIIVDVTQYCNLACIHCPHGEFAKSEVFSGAHLDVELHKKLIDEIATDGLGYCQYIRYTANGETLIHPKIDEILEYACKNSKTKINVTTNGMLLSETKAKKLLDIGIDVFDISIDAFSNEVYSKIRVKGDLNQTKANVLKLIDLIQKYSYKTKVVVSFVEQPFNSHEVKAFESFWKKAGADFVVVRKLHSAGGAKKGIKSKMEEHMGQIERKPCVYPWERLVLTPLGTIGFCPADWKHQSEIADFRQYSIKEIWGGEFMQKLREAHLKNSFCGLDFCQQCPDWLHTKWPGEGRGYIDVMKDLVPLDLLG